MSIVRVGLAETKQFAEGYEAIFGKKKSAEAKKAPARATAKKTARSNAKSPKGTAKSAAAAKKKGTKKK